MMHRDDLRGPLGLSLAAVGAMIIIVIWLAVPVSRTIAHLRGGEAPDPAIHARTIEAHLDVDRVDRNRIHGRSFFFDPPAPPAPPPPEPTGACCMSETECQILERSECRVSGGTWKGGSSCTEETCKPREIAPPPPPLPPSGPSRYAGPDLVMVWGSDAVFKQNDDLIVIPRGQVLEEIEVVAIDAPRTVTVHWRGGGPFELDLFPADELPSANETVTDTLLEGRSRPHVEDNRPTRGASGAHTP